MFADRLIVRQIQVVELRAVVVADETGHLLTRRRLGVHDGRRTEAMRLLTPRDERLAELATNRLASVEAQMSRSRGETEQLLGPRRAQPLKRDRQRRPIELLADGIAREFVHR